jgi:hypothetical protein
VALRPATILARVRWEARVVAGRFPWAAERFVLPAGSRITGETEVVIDGFPRSGNTFAVVAFRQAQSRQVSVAHHGHVPALAIEAHRRGVPALVLIREPEEAVLSFVVRLPRLTVRQALRSYLRYYEPLIAHRDGFVVTTLGQLRADFGEAIRRLNARFATSFAEFEPTEDHVRSVLEEVDRWDRGAFGTGEAFERSRARPSEQRDSLKELLRPAYLDPALKPLRAKAERLHTRFAAWAVTPG